jgi:hypothetical protein
MPGGRRAAAESAGDYRGTPARRVAAPGGQTAALQPQGPGNGGVTRHRS